MTRVVVLTPNPAVDITYEVGQHELGTTVRVQRVHRRPGGKGVNVAAVLHALGQDVLALLPLGGANGRWVERALHSEGVPTSVVYLGEPATRQRDEQDGSSRETRSTVTVVAAPYAPTVYSEAGPSVPTSAWDQLVERTGQLCQPGGWFVVAGSFPPGGHHTVGPLVRAAHGAGASVLVDTTGSALLSAATAGADVLKPNAMEAMDATGEAEPAAAARNLLNRSAACVVLSLGQHGLDAYDGGTVIHQPAVPGVAGNPTGAGDAATAGLVDALARGADLPTALRSAAVLGAAAVMNPVAGQVDTSDLAAMDARLVPLPDRDGPRTPAESSSATTTRTSTRGATGVPTTRVSRTEAPA